MKKYTNFDEMFNDDDYVSQAEREQINFQVELIGKIIEARESKGLSQRELAELSGIRAACHCQNGKYENNSQD